MSDEMRQFKEDLTAIAVELDFHREMRSVLRADVLPLVDNLVALVESEHKDAGDRKKKALDRYAQPLRAIQYILHKRLDD